MTAEAITTVVLRVEHVVPDYEVWKREGFDRDPLDRTASGVLRHRVLRRDDEASTVAVELEFADRTTAESFEMALRGMWGQVRDRFGWRELPEAHIFELAEAEEY
jgi:hypothetical protein